MKLTLKPLLGLLLVGLSAGAFAQPGTYSERADRQRPPNGPLVCRWRAVPPLPPPGARVRMVRVQGGRYQDCTQYRTHHQWVPQGSEVTFFVPDTVDFR